jgi:hypothetical protein
MHRRLTPSNVFPTIYDPICGTKGKNCPLKINIGTLNATLTSLHSSDY